MVRKGPTFLIVPIASFVLALLLAAVTAPRTAVARRAPSMMTGDCTHTFSKRRTPSQCISFETGPDGELDESDCVDRAPTDVNGPGLNREIRLVRMVENDTKTPGGAPIDESEANTIAGGRDGGLVLNLGGFHEVRKALTRVTGPDSCCHTITIDCAMSVSTGVNIDAPVVRGNSGYAVALSRGTAVLQPDCGGKGVTKVVTVLLVARRHRDFMFQLEDSAYSISIDNGVVTGPSPLPFPDPNLGGGTNKSVTPEITPPAGPGVSALATARFEGEHRVSVWAPLVNNKAATSRGRTRLKFLTLNDQVEGVGESPP